MKLRMTVFGVLAVMSVLLAVYYFATPADSLLQFLPGYEGGVTDHHYKHGLAALILAIGCGLLIWFSSGKKSSPSDTSEPEE